jgi:hypothetical protein
MPLEASPIQILESRRAFYAGATAMLTGIIQLLIDQGPDRDEPVDLARLDALQMELRQFEREIEEGERGI